MDPTFMEPALVDYHCHLDLYPDHKAAFGECERHKITTLAVTTTPRAWEHNQELALETKYVRAALGLHPQLVQQHFGEIKLFENLLHRTKHVGEIGLDASPAYYASYPKQKDIFERILRLCAAQKGKILSIHSVRSVRDVLALIEKHYPTGSGFPVLHWFTGSTIEAERAAHLGCYFSINREMLLKEKGQELVRRLPLTRMLTETDGPFTTIQGRPTKPIDIGLTVELLAKVCAVELSKLRDILAANVEKIEATRVTSPRYGHS